MNMNDFDIIEWTCVWAISMVVFIALLKIYANGEIYDTKQKGGDE